VSGRPGKAVVALSVGMGSEVGWVLAGCVETRRGGFGYRVTELVVIPKD